MHKITHLGPVFFTTANTIIKNNFDRFKYFQGAGTYQIALISLFNTCKN